MSQPIKPISPEITMTDADSTDWYVQHDIFPGEDEDHDPDILAKHDADYPMDEDGRDADDPMDKDDRKADDPKDGGDRDPDAMDGDDPDAHLDREDGQMDEDYGQRIISSRTFYDEYDVYDDYLYEEDPSAMDERADKPANPDGRSDHPTLPLAEGEDPDDPPFDGTTTNRTTVGVELEFLVAAARADNTLDQHPADGRGLLPGVEGIGSENARFQTTVRNAIVDALRTYGLATAKGESPHISLGASATFGWSSRLDQDSDANNSFAFIKDNWRPDYTWNRLLTHDQNLAAGVTRLLDLFVQFHEFRKLRFRSTTQRVIESIGGLLNGFVSGAPASAWPVMRDSWIERTRAEFGRRWLQEDQVDANVVDPRAVLLPGADPKYRAWTCTRDSSFSAETAKPEHYNLKGFVPPIGSDFPAPPTEYKWFSGEVVSPILDFDNKSTYVSIFNACNALRSTFRIHKPMSVIGTGLHVHFGQEQGFSLLDLKKFMTLWLLLEESIEKLHRQDRSQKGHFFSQSLRENSNLAKNITAPSDGPSSRSTLRNRDPAKADYYNARALEHVDFTIPQISDYMEDLIRELWQYETVDDLNYGMTVQKGAGHIRYRLSGVSRTDPPKRNMFGPVLQTLEFRIMQGSLDAEHIWRWMVICRQLILFSRHTSAAWFRARLAGLLTAMYSVSEVFNLPANLLTYFVLRLSPETGYFMYIDQDKVDWNFPFMTQGGATMHF